jgi:acyltransferase
MPLFFVLSGYLCNESKYAQLTTWGFVSGRFRRLYVPAVIIGLSCVVPYFYFKSDMSLADFGLRVFGTLYSIPLVEWNFNCTPIWFLFCLFCVDTLYFLICKYVKVNRLAVVVAVFSVGIVISRNLEVYMPFNFQVSLVALLFYYAGVKLRSNRFVETHRPRWCLMFVSLLLLLSVVLLNPVKVGFAANRYGDLNYLFIGSFSGMYLVYFWADKLNQSRLLGFWGKNTIAILGYNYWAYIVTQVFLNKVGAAHWSMNFLLQMFLFSVALFCLNKMPYLNSLLQGVPIASVPKKLLRDNRGRA